MKFAACAAVAGLALALAAPATPALAWGNTGHRLVGLLGAQALPSDMPAFLRTAQAAVDIGEYARELDRSKGSGRIHDNDRDPGHFVDTGDDGTVFGGPKITALPPNRAGYETALRAVKSDSWNAGYLPYSLVDGWQQLSKDFTFWRVLSIAEKREKNSAKRAYYKADRIRREALIIRDLGVWAHYVGDASQPLHDTIHYNGWGDQPNPNGYTKEPIHGPFEEAFVDKNITTAKVKAKMAPYHDCACAIEAHVAAYLTRTQTYVEPLYQMWGQGLFTNDDPQAVDWTAARIAEGADELRDLIYDAWKASEKGNVGYKPSVTPADVAGGADPFLPLYGTPDMTK